ncbi:MAG: type II toxin-antitoxin system Phd/YefM family antitoxin [Desulfobulbaceae bacterium]|nr:type II toxin-antitoxin system Phd/YefM family antitoxin [Desulfobulbaceae bacterium]
MQTVNIHEAKTNLSRLIEQAVKGESLTIVTIVPPSKTAKEAKSPLDF